MRGNAGIDSPEGEFDVDFARFGTIFFVRSVAVLRTMRRAPRPGRLVAHIVWRAPPDTPWHWRAKGSGCASCRRPGRGTHLRAGPVLHCRRADTVRKMREVAGYADIRVERVDAPVLICRVATGCGRALRNRARADPGLF